MSYRCDNCQSLFFKTLETRLCGEGEAILYKKRCKRCKYKYLIRKAVPGGQVHAASLIEWAGGTKIHTRPETISERGRTFIGEYSRRASRPADETLPYLSRLDIAIQAAIQKDQAHAAPQIDR